ncbi:MAG: alpha/beta hydrolase [Candidatus Nomurabacteria bacterium]|jgi:predicted alpha/beta hydrolase family esterase|nr:alpha/beta hydrolase [Candidatus Nomurabacteria bacterium]
MKIVIIHGAYGDPNENWFPWLAGELRALGHEVYVPKFPTPDGQNVENWCEVLQRETPFEFDGDTILIGHSVGATYVLNVLNRQRREPIKAAFLVAGFAGELGNPKFDVLNETFVNADFDWDLIRRSAEKFVLMDGDNDPYVPRVEVEKLAKNLKIEPIWIKNGGHLNAAAGYTEFSELLNLIKEELK